jgi:hypothetical protein
MRNKICQRLNPNLKNKKMENVIKTTSAKYLLTTMLPNEINYGHTIDEAEKDDVISDVMEEYAEIQALEFVEFIEVEGFRRLEQSEDYSNGEQHCTRSEIYQKYLESKE